MELFRSAAVAAQALVFGEEPKDIRTELTYAREVEVCFAHPYKNCTSDWCPTVPEGTFAVLVRETEYPKRTQKLLYLNQYDHFDEESKLVLYQLENAECLLKPPLTTLRFVVSTTSNENRFSLRVE